MYRIYIVLLFILTILFSCGQSQGETVDMTTLNDSLPVYYYTLRVNGQYDSYVKGMQSCDSATEQYKKSIINNLSHYHKDLIKEKQGVNKVEVLRKEMHDHGNMANVYLGITYNDSSHEEILFPMVFDGKNWRIQ